jgi:hypothetical protein
MGKVVNENIEPRDEERPAEPPKILTKPLPQILDEMESNIRSAAEAARKAEEAAGAATKTSGEAAKRAEEARKAGEGQLRVPPNPPLKLYPELKIQPEQREKRHKPRLRQPRKQHEEPKRLS